MTRVWVQAMWWFPSAFRPCGYRPRSQCGAGSPRHPVCVPGREKGKGKGRGALARQVCCLFQESGGFPHCGCRLHPVDGRWVTGPPLLPGSGGRWSCYLSRTNSVKRDLYTTNSAFLTYKINTFVRTEKMPTHFRLGPWPVLFKKENVQIEET